MSGAFVQLLSGPESPKLYANEVWAGQIRDIIPIGGDILHDVVIFTKGKMPKYICVANEKINVQQVLPCWYLANFSHLNMLSAYANRAIPLPPVQIWANWSVVDCKTRTEFINRPFNHRVKLEAPHRNLVHVNKLQRLQDCDLVTDISFLGVPAPINISMNGVTVFEIPDADTRMAYEIMCRGRSTYHLGNCLAGHRVDLQQTMQKMNQQYIKNIRSNM